MRHYTSWYFNYKGESFITLEKENIFRILKPDKHDVIMDAGCADGRLSFELANLVKEIHAFDFSKEGIEELDGKIKSKGISNIKTGVVDLTAELPAGLPAFDKVISIQVLQHISGQQQLKKAIKNIYNAIKPGGSFITLNYSSEKIMKKIRKQFGGFLGGAERDGYHAFMIREIRELCLEAGFKKVNIETSHHIPPRFYAFKITKYLLKLDAFAAKLPFSRYFGHYLIVEGKK
ncbi:MAG: methyltransferase domain-containing protein [Candidatus Poribacteria bacterium]